MASIESRSKTEIVAEFLATPEAQDMTDAEIALKLSVGKATVYHARQSLKAESSGHKPATVRMIPVSQLRGDDRLQAREGHDPAALQRYREMFREGRQPPPLIVFANEFKDDDDREVFDVVEGFGRLWSARQEKVESLPCEVRSGSYEDMVLVAAASNADHGVPRTERDEYRAIRMVLENVKEARNWGIERLAQATRTTTYRVRKFLQANRPAPVSSSCDSQGDVGQDVVERTRKDGSTYTIDRDKFRTKKAEPEAEETIEEKPETPQQRLDREVQSILDRSALYPRLAPACQKAYREDVGLWLRYHQTAAELLIVLASIDGRRLKGEPIGHLAATLDWAFRLPHPLGGESDGKRGGTPWLGCSDCLRDGIHTGTRPDQKNPCGSCNGRGYSIPGAH